MRQHTHTHEQKILDWLNQNSFSIWKHLSAAKSSEKQIKMVEVYLFSIRITHTDKFAMNVCKGIDSNSFKWNAPCECVCVCALLCVCVCVYSMICMRYPFMYWLVVLWEIWKIFHFRWIYEIVRLFPFAIYSLVRSNAISLCLDILEMSHKSHPSYRYWINHSFSKKINKYFWCLIMESHQIIIIIHSVCVYNKISLWNSME